jgi:hypothetical protein
MGKRDALKEYVGAPASSKSEGQFFEHFLP